MQIWVDADACPKAIKDILFRVAQRTGITTTLVANQFLPTPPSRYIKFLQVRSGFDVADNEIVRKLNVGDLVITGDIPLAYEVVIKGGHAINPRGRALYPGQHRGIDTGGPSALNPRDIQAFVNQLDRFLAQHIGKSLR